MSTTLKGAALALAIGLLSSPAVAGGPGSGAQSLIGTAADTTVIQQVHLPSWLAARRRRHP